MAQEILIGGALILIPAAILLLVEWNVARKRRAARNLSRRRKSRDTRPNAAGE